MTAINGAPTANGVTNGGGASGADSTSIPGVEQSALLPKNESEIIGSNYVHEPKAARVIFIGTGLSGVAFAYKAREVENLQYTIYEKNPDVGGVWYEHSYPGISCDVPAHAYSYTWRGNPNWSRFYAGGDEIREWLKTQAKDYGLYEHTKFQHKVANATWNEQRNVWVVEVEDLVSGTKFTDEAEVLVNGGGTLNNWKWPNIEGLHDFEGSLVHTAHWNNDIKLEGKRVAVIGSGASGIQIVPAIQPIVSKLINFVRSPTWIAPDFAWQLAENGRETFYSDEQRKEWRENPEAMIETRRNIEHTMNVRFPSFYKHSEAQKCGRGLVEKGMRHALKDHPELAKKLVPKFELGCRRVTPGQGYLQALTKPTSKVVTSGIQKVVANGIISNDGEFHEVDVIITATGYDSTFVPRFPIIGSNGQNLQDKWRKETAAAYLSVAVPGFPNYFIALGPNAPISNGSLVTALEKSLDYILKFVGKIQKQGVASAVVTEEAAKEFDDWKNEIMKGLSWSGSCTSWYKNGTTDGPVTGPWPGSVNHFLEIIKEPRYEDFLFKYRSKNRFKYFGDGRSPKEAKGEHLGWYIEG